MLLPTVGIGNETPENPELLVLITLSVLVGANGSKIFDQIQKLMMLYQGDSYFWHYIQTLCPKQLTTYLLMELVVRMMKETAD